MKPLETALGIHDPDWLMSAREKLTLIGILELLRPAATLEFGYHKGGATKWLAKFSKKVVTVDVNEHVSQASADYPNVEAWNLPTQEAVQQIKKNNLRFDLAIIDADHSRQGVKNDLQGLVSHCDLIILHDASNPECRKGMMDILAGSDSKYAYNLDLITSALKHDGLWGGFGVVITTSDYGKMQEFRKEFSPYRYLRAHDLVSLSRRFCTIKSLLARNLVNLASKTRILAGKALRTFKLRSNS